MLSNNLLRIYRLPKSIEIQEAIRLFNQNLLERMTEPTEKHEEDEFNN